MSTSIEASSLSSSCRISRSQLQHCCLSKLGVSAKIVRVQDRLDILQRNFRSLPLQPLFSPIMACLGVGRFEDTLNGFVQHGVDLSIGLLGREPFC
jgi:hypothetical protein